MKKAEIAINVFEAMDSAPLTELVGGELVVPVVDLAGLSLVPWFCDISVQWALRLTMPGSKLKKSLLQKVNDASIMATEAGAVLVGVPGDGIEPSTYTLFPLAKAVAKVARPGMVLELATANLGVIRRDWETKAETNTPHGNQRYVGTADGQCRWVITQTTPALTVAALNVALSCGRMVARNGPWEVKDKSEAYAVAMHWLRSATVNPMAVKRFVALKDGAFRNSNPDMIRMLYGLGLGFVRHRLDGGPLRWPEPGPSRHTNQQLEEVARAVVG
jgi:hypothetical protein